MVQHPTEHFQLIQTTRAINKIPNKWNLPINPFRNEGIMTTGVRIQEINGVLSILPVKIRGEAPTVNNRDTRTFRYIDALHIPFQDRIEPQDIQNSVDWNTGKQLDGITQAVARILRNHREKHAMTLRWLRMGAMKGLVLNNDNTTLIDFYAEFGITQKTIDFSLSVDTTDVRKLCHEIHRHTEDHLLGENMNSIVCWCSSGFFDALVAHPQVEKAFINHGAAIEKLGGDIRKGFNFGGIEFSEYRGRSTDGKGNVRKFIADDEAHCFPLGTSDTFVTYFAPPVLDGLNQINRNGLELYAMRTNDLKGRCIDIDSESDPLPICRRPALLVKVTMS